MSSMEPRRVLFGFGLIIRAFRLTVFGFGSGSEWGLGFIIVK